MLRLTRASDGAHIYVSAALVASVGPDLHADATEVCVGGFTHTVRGSPEEVARLVAVALRPAPAVDLEAVDLARRLLTRLAEVCDTDPLDVDDLGGAIDDVLATDASRWWHTAAGLRALAARLGGAS